ncbi:hypothetical protein GCM10012288_04870 [Malaciobacter pacificus]|uniref:Uncharacterized protein n=1 Tax=Malaciobacter pacificus TaxID=1080223 RepID=A0A5C2H6R6_9BACT|nr:hypothetical protein [Malaciobacter pacificus]QEP34513.1 hypothetical protein APAC_1404 [Malaciobacter pacificus]GGD33894.1 hypothetical protein GCM10012288_04870 [Malaciobacter pacificus]
MKISNFLEDIKNNQEEVVYYCCKHLLSKKFDVENDSIEDSELKELFINYDNFTKSLNDSTGIIYRKYKSELNDIYKIICEILNEDPDNEYLFNYRLARVKNQEPKQFLDIEDKDTQETVVQKFEDKINTILESKYYKKNEDKLFNEMIIPQKTLDLIKSAIGLS